MCRIARKQKKLTMSAQLRQICELLRKFLENFIISLFIRSEKFAFLFFNRHWWKRGLQKSKFIYTIFKSEICKFLYKYRDKLFIPQFDGAMCTKSRFFWFGIDKYDLFQAIFKRRIVEIYQETYQQKYSVTQ